MEGIDNNESKQFDCSRGCIVERPDDGELKCTYRPGCCKLEVYDWLPGVVQEKYRNYFEVRFKNTRKGIYLNASGQTVKMNDYVATEAGGEWFVNAAETPAQLLASADAAEAAGTVEIPVKETNGHGTDFWPSPITFPGNIQAIKDFVTENGFDYDYYADGGMTQNEEGYWQTPDAVSGATLSETPTYLDMLKTLYERIQAGEYVAEN